MHRAHRRLAIVGALAIGLIAAASAAFAATPVRTVEAVHIEGTFPAGTRCPFEVVRTIDGTLVTTVFTDSSGLTTTAYSYKNGKIVYTNPANGKTLTAVLAGPAVYVDNGDGTTTLTIPGNDQRYVAPGIGLIVANTGLIRATLDSVTGEILSIDFEAGMQDGTPFPALCVGLE